MTDPTIDQMLIWVSGLEHWNPDTLNDNKVMLRAIRAILEQHRDTSIDAIRAVISEERGRDLLVIRAFVERVGVHYASDKLWGTGEIETYLRLMREELAAMEKEGAAT
jgi:hypothetical protein